MTSTYGQYCIAQYFIAFKLTLAVIVSSITFASYICCIYAPEFGQYWTLFCLGNSSVPDTPYMQFLFVRPRFCPWVSILPTSGFLQIPPRDGHPCLRLTVPTAKSVADFHRQVIAHAERTTMKRTSFAWRDKRGSFIDLDNSNSRKRKMPVYCPFVLFP